jgi:hypothetical protein
MYGGLSIAIVSDTVVGVFIAILQFRYICLCTPVRTLRYGGPI